MKTNSDFYQNIIGLYDDRGKAWLDQLPRLLQQYEGELDVKLQPPFNDLTYNYVAPAVLSNGNHVVFKCGIPNKELTTEIAALKHFDGNGAVRLMNSNGKAGWSFVFAVLSACWIFEDNSGEIESLLRCANELKKLL